LNKILLGKRIRVGSGSGREVDAAPGCLGYGQPIVLQQTDVPSADPIGAFGTPSTPPPQPVAPWTTVCGMGGAVGWTATNAANATTGTDCSAAVTPTGDGPVGGYVTTAAVGSITDANCYAMMWETAPGECDQYTCAAGTWIVPQEVCGNVNAPLWTDCYVLRVSSSGAPLETIGHAVGPFFSSADDPYSLPLGSLVARVSGRSVLFTAGDKVVILLIFTYKNEEAADHTNSAGDCNPTIGSGSGGSIPLYMGPGFGHASPIFTPMYDKRAVFPAIRLSKGSGSGSGATRDVWAIARGCGPYRLAKKIRKSSPIALGVAATKELWAFADCCPPYLTNGSGGGGGDGGGGGGDIGIACFACNGVAASEFAIQFSGVVDITPYPGFAQDCFNMDLRIILHYQGATSDYCLWQGTTFLGVATNQTGATMYLQLFVVPCTGGTVQVYLLMYGIITTTDNPSGLGNLVDGFKYYVADPTGGNPGSGNQACINWDCKSSLTLYKSVPFNTAVCMDWPPTITIAPV
jgi:hypothetical protein